MHSQRQRLSAIPYALLLAAAVCCTGAKAEDPIGDRWGQVNRAIVEGHVMPRYLALRQAMGDLEIGTRFYCNSPLHARIDFVRQLFRAAQHAWGSVEHIAVGPVEQDRRRPRLNFWPDKHGTAEKQIRLLLATGDAQVLTPDSFRNGSVGIQGLSAMEQLLFPIEEHPASDFIEGGKANFRCQLMASIGRNLAEIADGILVDWTTATPSYRQRLFSAHPDDAELGSQHGVSALFLRDLAAGLDNILEQKLYPAMGKDAAEARPRRAEAWRSGASLALIRANLDSLHHLYMTAFAPLLTPGTTQAEVDDKVRATFHAARSAATAIDRPLSDAVVDPERRPLVKALVAEILTLQRLFAEDVSHALALPVGLNAFGGD